MYPGSEREQMNAYQNFTEKYSLVFNLLVFYFCLLFRNSAVHTMSPEINNLAV